MKTMIARTGFLILIVSTAVFAQQTTSVYTDLGEKTCTTIESNPNEGGSYRGECKGAAGFKLEVLEGDLRQTVNVIFPSGEKSELDLWTKVSGAFSAVGERAEWRIQGKGRAAKPFALIIRFNASEDPEKPEKMTSYLVVSKISENAACITDIVKPSKDQNTSARKLADKAANKSCL